VNAELESTLASIVIKLKEGRYPNEQAVSQGIVLQVLHRLSWPTFDTTVVWPEYRTAEGRADFALCDPAGSPAVFIEVKAPGYAEDAVRQALDYAFHMGGVPLVVLTDGITWSFYLTMEKGTYDERRVYKLDLFERSPAESAAKLQQYLDRDRTHSGQALESAIEEYRGRHRASQARAAIPEAWQELVEKVNGDLISLIAREAESKSGFRPTDADIIEFLSSLARRGSVQPSAFERLRPHVEHTVPRLPKADPPAPSGGRRLTIQGKAFQFTNAQAAMAIVLSEFAQRDATFLQRFSEHPSARGHKRRYIARAKEELYPDRPDLWRYHLTLPGGWLVGTNISNRGKKKIIRLATEVAGLTFDKDVMVEF
jgi:hypothetical protein